MDSLPPPPPTADWLNQSYAPSANAPSTSTGSYNYAEATSSPFNQQKKKLLNELHTIRVSYHQSAKALHHKLFAQRCLNDDITPNWLKLSIEPNFAGDSGITKHKFRSIAKEFQRKTLTLTVSHYRQTGLREQEIIKTQRKKCQEIIRPQPQPPAKTNPPEAIYTQTSMPNTSRMQRHSPHHWRTAGRTRSTQAKNES